MKRRLHLGFAFAIFFVIMVGVISFVTLQQQNRQSALVKQTYQVINKLEDIQRILVDMETGRRGFRATNDTKFLDTYYAGLRDIDPSFQQLTSLITDRPEQQKLAQELRLKVDDLLNYWRSLGTDASRLTRESILQKGTIEKEKMDSIRLLISNMISIENVVLAKRENANARSVTLAMWELIVGILLVLLVVVLLIVQILKEFKNRRRAELRLKRNLKQVAALNQENVERNWLLSGVAEVNDRLQTQLNVEQLTSAILNTIVKCLNAPAGAFYIFDEDEQQFQRSSSYALPAASKQSYNVKEGLVGQAGSQKDVLIIKDIPADYVTIEGGTMNANAVYACYTPVFADDKVKGVIEILSFSPFNDRHIDFLRIISKNIAVAINSEQSKEKVMMLLEQVQHQKETLENQQEELRQTNEELSLQTEVLQASEEELRVQEEELRQINDELEERNTALETAQEELSFKAKELQDTSKFKSEFLANMSHELRTPLNSVLILAKLLADNPQRNLTEKQVAHAKIIHKSGSDLLRLINDILDLSKIEAGKVEVHIEDTPIENIATDMEQLFGVVAEEKHIRYSVKIDDRLPEKIKTDKQRLEQILKNLLSNAFKFTPPNGFVELAFQRTTEDFADMVNISVTDSGIGIAQKKQASIFEAFQQADGATNRKYGGTGLGLSITRELVKLLMGKIKVDSREGQGSTFTVLLPLNRVSGSTSQPIDNEEKNPALLSNVEEQTLIADDRHRIGKDDKVMLIIEDDIDFATLMKGFAHGKGYKTIVALKGDEGLMCARKYQPTAIILDMTLPVINGSELLQIFKNDEGLKNIPVHVISGSEDVKLSSSSVLAFLKKPLEKQEIDNAFTLIEEYLHAAVKHVLVLSEHQLKDDILEILAQHSNKDIRCDVATSVKEALEKVKTVRYDCIIADIRTNVEKGIAQVRMIYDKLLPQRIPTIIYLDEDITATDEIRLKRMADVIVRKSALSNNRLMDELELFLYKVQEDTKLYKYSSNGNTDNSLEKKKVLVVDDDMRNVFALSAALEQEDMQILTASDGKEALQALERHQGIDIVLMDIMMPEMDGYEAIRTIRNKMRLTKLPIIALTAKAMAGDKEKCIDAGASDYITKPVDIQKLVSLMRVWLS